LQPQWESLVRDVLERATLTTPNDVPRQAGTRGGRTGAHSEFLGHMLAEMQIVARSHPGASW
jgi:ring-1,2-phenylacetyl-CoA epoxidase subunit PaaC